MQTTVCIQGRVHQQKKREKGVVTFSLSCYGGTKFDQVTKQEVIQTYWQNCVVFGTYAELGQIILGMEKGKTVVVKGYLRPKEPYEKDGKVYDQPELIVQEIGTLL